MAIITIKTKGYKCERCNHQWLPKEREPTKDPIVCPNCNSPYWNTPKKEK